MPAKTEYLTLNSTEQSSILDGLDQIVNGIGEIKVNNRRSPEMLYPGVAGKYHPRDLTPTVFEKIYDQLLQLRVKLRTAAVQRTTKFRLNLWGVTIAAFGFRVCRNRRLDKQARAFDRKLEKYRKRLKRRAQAALGEDEYRLLEMDWTKFRNWVRFNILPLSYPKAHFLRALQHEQRDAILAAGRVMLAERCETSIREDELLHWITLAMREIKRGRHGSVTVRLLGQDPAAAKDFLFTFIKKRVPTIKVRYEYRTWCEQAAVKTKLMKEALRLPVQPECREALNIETISEAKVIDKIARFFIDNIHPDDQEKVDDQVRFMAKRRIFSSVELKATTLQQLLEAVQPDFVGDGAVYDDTNLYTYWLLDFLFALNASPEKAARLVHSGRIQAMRLPAVA